MTKPKKPKMESVATVPPGQFGPRGTDWAAVCKQVDALGGDWGNVGEYDRSTVTKINAGVYPAVDPALYQATSRTKGGVTTIWLRRRQPGDTT